jgi:thymidine kinase
MGAGKSLDLLKTAHNYEERNKRVLLLTSDLDNRFGKKKIASRLGISKKADTFNKETDIYELVYHENQVPYSEHNPINSRKLSCVLIDESQFLTKEQVWQLTDVLLRVLRI